MARQAAVALLALAAVMQAFGAEPTARALPLSQSAMSVAQAVIDARRIPFGSPFDLAPDGKSVVYVTSRPAPDGATYDIELWICDVESPSAARLLATLPSTASMSSSAMPRFSPDGRSVVYLSDHDGGSQLMRIELPSGRPAPLIRAESLADTAGLAGATALKFAWSPDGRAIAVIMAPVAQTESTTGIETSVNWPNWTAGPGNRLVLLDLQSGRLRVLTQPDLDVTSVSWPAQGARLAIAASPTTSADRFFDQDLYIVDVETGSTRPVVSLPGIDSEPAWSPDGAHIAFATQAGEGSKDWLQMLGVLDVATGKVSFPARAEFEAGLGTPHNLGWTSNDRVLLTALHQLQAPLFEIALAKDRLRRFDNGESTFTAGAVVAARAHSIAFVRESPSRPGDLFVTPSSAYRPRRATNLNPAIELPPLDLQTVDWRSRDDAWDLHGILLKDPRAKGRLPLITIIEGGPAMVRLEFGLGLQYPVHALVASGYAVFVPNTRGRGGYSYAFRRAIRTEKDYVGGGFGDLMSGIDHLLRAGVADPARLGIAGFSYGAVLSAYAITQTQRFAAASINDAAFDFPAYAATFAANPDGRRMWDDMIGFSDVYDVASATRMREQSPLHQVERIRTPCLLESGTKAFGGMDDGVLPLFQALRRFDVPVEFIRYPRTGHGIEEPRLRAESARRNLEWFDYWVAGHATQRMLERYGPRTNSVKNSSSAH
jgi:dipeptidyl aminopeptidase/acylaminoacyl peptidase